MSQFIDAVLTNEDIEECREAINILKAKLPFLINISPRKKQSIPKLSDNRIGFVREVMSCAKLEPKIVPAYVHMDEVEQSTELFLKLSKLDRELIRLAESVNDTRAVVGSHSYLNSLYVYDSAKVAAKTDKINGIDTLVNNMKKHFM